MYIGLNLLGTILVLLLLLPYVATLEYNENSALIPFGLIGLLIIFIMWFV